MGIRGARLGNRQGQIPGPAPAPDPLSGARHTALAAKNDLKQREEISRANLKKFSEWSSSFQLLQLTGRLVPDPRQAATLIVRETMNSQHFFAVQNHPASAFEKEGASGPLERPFSPNQLIVAAAR